MKRILYLAVILFAVALALGADAPKPTRGIFSSLKVGQKVSLKDEGQKFTLTIYESEVPQIHTIKEVKDDFIVVDTFGAYETTISVYAIKAIVSMKLGKK